MESGALLPLEQYEREAEVLRHEIVDGWQRVAVLEALIVTWRVLRRSGTVQDLDDTSAVADRCASSTAPIVFRLRVSTLLESEPGWWTVAELAGMLAADPDEHLKVRVRSALTRMVARGEVNRAGDRYASPVAGPIPPGPGWFGPGVFRERLLSLLESEPGCWTVAELADMARPGCDTNFRKRVRGSLQRMVADGDAARVGNRYCAPARTVTAPASTHELGPRTEEPASDMAIGSAAAPA